MLIAQRPHAPRFHQKRRLLQPLPNPPHRKRPQNMPVAHHQHIPLPLFPRLIINFTLPDHRLMILLPYISDQPIHPFRDVLRTLPLRTPIAPDIPGFREALGFAERADVVGGDALVGAVVPFGDVGGDCDGGGGAGMVA